MHDMATLGIDCLYILGVKEAISIAWIIQCSVQGFKKGFAIVTGDSNGW